MPVEKEPVQIQSLRSTAVTIENENGIYRVQVNQTEMTLSDVIEFLIKPVLLATGYLPEHVTDRLGEG
jgi:hypothetical protein